MHVNRNNATCYVVSEFSAFQEKLKNYKDKEFIKRKHITQ